MNIEASHIHDLRKFHYCILRWYIKISGMKASMNHESRKDSCARKVLLFKVIKIDLIWANFKHINHSQRLFEEVRYVFNQV